jgi:hypothetical protein
MISGLVLKYLNGECFVIRRGYETTLLASPKFNMTVPNHFPYDASVDVDGFSRVHNIIRIHRALQSCH